MRQEALPEAHDQATPIRRRGRGRLQAGRLIAVANGLFRQKLTESPISDLSLFFAFRKESCPGCPSGSGCSPCPTGCATGSPSTTPVDLAPERLWDWRDTQLLRLLRNGPRS